MKNCIEVIKEQSGYRLRLHLDAKDGGLVRFESTENFTKKEADFRAVMLSNVYGLGRDELPNHEPSEPYPARDL